MEEVKGLYQGKIYFADGILLFSLDAFFIVV